MKTLLTIFLGFLLAGTQAVVPASSEPGAAAALKARCGCSGCSTSCCPASPAQSPLPESAIPSAGQQSPDWQALVYTLLSVRPDAAGLTAGPTAFASRSPRALVPLYERNCAYLI
jgi:hypothetical protein